jgi:hypothetical protein
MKRGCLERASAVRQYMYTSGASTGEENDGKTRVNCRLFITDGARLRDALFCFYHRSRKGRLGLDHFAPIAS